MAEPSNVEDIYRLAPAQEGMLYHALLQRDAYFTQFAFTVERAIDVDAFRKAWARVFERHGVLRSSCHWEDLEHPVQVVRRGLELPFRFEDQSTLTADAARRWEDDYFAKNRAAGFQLEVAPLLRVLLVRRGPTEHRLFVAVHHMLVDAWSLRLLVREVFALHDAYARGEELALPEVRPFRELVAWQHARDRGAAQAHFAASLKGYDGPAPLPGDRAPRVPTAESDPFGEDKITLDVATSTALRAIAARHQVPLALLLRAAWGLLVGLVTGEPDVVTGVVHSGRSLPVPGVEAMIGLLLTTLPMRVVPDPAARLGPWLRAELARELENERHAGFPLTDVATWAGLAKGVPLFETLVVFTVDTTTDGGDDAVRAVGARADENSGYPLTLVVEADRAITLILAYNARRFPEGGAWLLDHYRVLLAAIVAKPDAHLGALTTVGADERQQLLEAWQPVPSPRPAGALAHTLVAAAARKTPSAIAVESGGEKVTFAELDDASTRLAHVLIEAGVGPESRVALCAEPGVEPILGMLAVQKAGGAYVPLDPEAPRERLETIVERSKIQVLLTQARLVATLAGLVATVVELDTVRGQLASRPATPPAVPILPTSLAYVVYTSGTTGEPKGVEVTHASVVNHALAMGDELRLAPSDRVLQFTPIHYDAAVEEIYPPLARGSTVVVRGELIPVDDFTRVIVDARLNVLSMPPAYVQEWLGVVAARGERLPATLRLMLLGGEAIAPELIVRWHALGGGKVRIVNVYGPTEATVTSASCDLAAPVAGVQTVLPIGLPIANTRLYVLDRALGLVPAGVTGELYIGGLGLARGYAARPELTAERFVPDPYARTAGARMYRTGDLAVHLPDGRLVFRGRADRQVKLRGMRIELGEIESALRKHPAVRDAVVATRPTPAGEPRLVAWVVGAEHASEAPTASALRAHVEQILPRGMIPSAFVVVAAIPLKSNGKVDLAALPEPAAQRDAERPLVEPRTPLEATLAGIWREVLGTPRVGVHDDFYALGGDSILAMRILARVRSATERDVPLRVVFAAPTIAEMALAIDAGARSTAIPLVPLERTGRPLPASEAQARLWVMHRLDPASLAYVIPIKLWVDGVLERAPFEQALRDVVQRHEVMRSTLDEVAGEVVQIVHADVPFLEPFVDLSGHADAEARAQALAQTLARRPMDLRKGPLLRVQLAKVGPKRHMLVFIYAHAIFDGTSAGIFYQEIAEAYAARRRGAPLPWAPLTIQYADYAAWERANLAGPLLEQELAWWKGALDGAPQILDLPTDRPRGTRSGANGRIIFETQRDLAERVRALAASERISVFTVVLVSYGLVLSRYAAQDDLLVAVDMETRDHEALEGLIGLIGNTLPLRLRVTGGQTGRELLRATQATVLEGLAHGLVPYQRIVQAVNPVRSPNAEALCQVGLQFDPYRPDAPWDGLAVDEFQPEDGAILTDMLVGISDLGPGRGLHVTINFAKDLFDQSTIARFAQNFLTALDGMVTSIDHKVEHVSMLPRDERDRVVIDWNRAAREVAPARLLHEVVAAQAKRTPDLVAVASSSTRETITYGELERRANQLAHALQARGAGPEVVVAVVMGQSPEAIVALLGVLKSGAAYAPLDPETPEARLTSILTDAKVSIVLYGAPDDDATRALPATPPPCATTPGGAAYVIYTSGTTGEPKGVVVSHRAVVNHCHEMGKRLELTTSDRVLQFTPLNYDAAGEEIYPTLARGATIVMRGEPISYDAFTDFIDEQGLTLVSLPPAFQHEWISAMTRNGQHVPPGLRLVLLGGERIHADTTRAWVELGGVGVPWLNAYGPTETTVTCAIGRFDPAAADVGAAPGLDGPLPGLRLQLLDRALEVVGIGRVGEIYVAGEGLARGYLGRPELTAASFVPDPTGPPGARMYRTGDLARFHQVANKRLELEIVGRGDAQVKLHGRRLELGEIEAALLRQPGVASAAATLRDDLPTGQGLVGYVVAHPDAVIAPHELRQGLLAVLPDFMVPSQLVMLAELPLTPNGKVDRRALPAPGVEDVATAAPTRTIAPPRSKTEKRLVAIWEELLGISPVGVDEDFFGLGGHSLLGMRLIGELNDEWKIDLPLTVLYDDATIAGLARAIADQVVAKLEEAPAAQVASTRSPLIVPLQPEGAGTPIFCVHDAIGTPIPFRHLAKALDKDRAAYLVQSPLCIGRPLPTTIGELADEYLAAVRTVVPTGPIILAGYSIGVYVAYEMAVRALARGEQVPRLVALDSLGWETMLRAGREEAHQPIELAQLAERITGAPVDDAYLQTLLAHEAAHIKLIEDYTPPAYCGQILVVATDGSLADYAPSLGWEDHAPGRVSVVRIAGRSHAPLEAETAPLTARALREALADV